MGFRQGAYAKIWKIEDKGNYHVAQMSISRKNKDTGIRHGMAEQLCSSGRNSASADCNDGY